VVGQAPPELAELPAERVHALPPCSPARFSTLLGSADMLLSLNVGATTMARAVLSDIPAVALTTNFAVPDLQAIPEVEAKLGGLSDPVRQWLTDMVPLHRMRMWPLGFHSFLDPILSDNPYTRAFVDIELLDEDAVLQGVTSALYDAPTRDRLAAARADYLKILDAQVDTHAAFAEAAGRLGLSL